MTQEEIAITIIRDGNCYDHPRIHCNECPLGVPLCADKVNNAIKWLSKHGGNMDKKAAIKRLDAIEEEAAKLREIIEKGDKIVYDENNIYIFSSSAIQYILIGYDKSAYYRLHSLASPSRTECGYDHSFKTGQECIDSAVDDGLNIHVFDNTKEALQFFIDHL